MVANITPISFQPIRKKAAKKNVAKLDTETKVSKEPKAEEKVSAKKTEEEFKFDLKLFNKWDTTEVVVKDLGLRDYINLSPMLVPYSAGRNIKKQFWKSKKSIIERLANKLMVVGHKGKKHWRTSGRNTGKITTQFKIIKNTQFRSKVNFIHINCFISWNGCYTKK